MTSSATRAPELGNVSVLNDQECRTLLESSTVGRVAFVGPTGPVIHPVNFLMDHGTIIVRTSPYTMFGAHEPRRVAFEVDELDTWMSRGWSVLVTGESAPIDDPDETTTLHHQGKLQPWADGTRNMYVRITPREISGRRIG